MIINKDPVMKCELYKKEGCSHVDGFLCDYNKCTMRMEFELFILEQQLGIPNHLRYYNRKKEKCT